MGIDPLARPITVAIVDGHDVLIEGVQSWIDRDPQHRVRMVGSGADLDEVLAGVGGTADVLLVDLDLRGKVQVVVDRVGELTAAGRKVVVFSARSNAEDVLAVLDAGAEFLAKDESRDHFVETVVAVAGNRPYVTPTSAGAMIADSRPQRPSLSERERTALLLWFQGMAKSSVAARMGISETTVKHYLNRARAKYAAAGRHAATKEALLVAAIEEGLIRLDEIGPVRDAPSSLSAREDKTRHLEANVEIIRELAQRGHLDTANVDLVRVLEELQGQLDAAAVPMNESAPASSELPFSKDQVARTTFGTEPGSQPDHLTFPVSVYLDNESGHENVEEALEALLRLAGVNLVERDDPILGSWYRRMRARTRNAANSPIAREAAAAAAHALDSRGVLAHDATVTATLMQNLGPLLTSLHYTKDAVIRVGALLIVKVDWVVAVHQLTSTQQLRLDHQPQLLTSPRDILHALDLAPGPVTSATNPTNGKWPSFVPPKDEPVRLDRSDEPLRMVVEQPDNPNM